MKHRFVRSLLTALVLGAGSLTLIATGGGGGDTPVDCTPTGGVSITTAGNGRNVRLGTAYVCAGEQVKVVWSFSNAESATLTINGGTSEPVPVSGERIVTVDKDLTVDMQAVGADKSCRKKSSAVAFAKHDGDRERLVLSHPNWNSSGPYSWHTFVQGAAITSGLRVKAIEFVDPCGFSPWGFSKIDEDGIRHDFLLNAGTPTQVDFHPSGHYHAFPQTEIVGGTCTITIDLILGC